MKKSNIFILIVITIIINSCTRKDLITGTNDLMYLQSGKSIDYFLEEKGYKSINTNGTFNIGLDGNLLAFKTNFEYANQKYSCYVINVENRQIIISNGFSTQIFKKGDFFYIITKDEIIKDFFYEYEVKNGSKQISDEMMISINLAVNKYLTNFTNYTPQTSEELNKNRKERAGKNRRHR